MHPDLFRVSASYGQGVIGNRNVEEHGGGNGLA